MAVIKDSEHIFIAGMTGSGKTFLAKTYLAGNQKPVFILDTKGTFEWEQIPEKLQITITRLSEIKAARQNYRYIIYRPIPEELNLEFYDAFFQFCYALRDCTVLVDEAAEVCTSPNEARMPFGYKQILARGRELNVNVWSCTQRPANIPILIYSEASHWFIFKLNALQDRKKLTDFSGYDEFLTAPDKFYFIYRDVDSGTPPVTGILKKGGAKST